MIKKLAVFLNSMILVCILLTGFNSNQAFASTDPYKAEAARQQAEADLVVAGDVVSKIYSTYDFGNYDGYVDYFVKVKKIIRDDRRGIISKNAILTMRHRCNHGIEGHSELPEEDCLAAVASVGSEKTIYLTFTTRECFQAPCPEYYEAATSEDSLYDFVSEPTDYLLKFIVIGGLSTVGMLFIAGLILLIIFMSSKNKAKTIK